MSSKDSGKLKPTPRLSLQAKELLRLMEELRLFERLKARYYRQWSETEPHKWQQIRDKLNMLDDLKAEIRSAANSKD